ncbi:hypothetical protein Tco_1217229 [Tanacetum coccineum]
MAASAIAISSDSSDESVGSPPSRVILFGDIPTVIPSTFVVAPETSTIAPVISSVAPVVETTLVASPTGLCGLVPYLGSDSNSPDEMSSLEYISPLPAISSFLCTDSSEALIPFICMDPPAQDPLLLPLFFGGDEDLVDVGPLLAHRLASRHASPRSSDHHLSSSSLSSDSSQFILRVWDDFRIRLILDLRLEMYHLVDCSLPSEESTRCRRPFCHWLLHYHVYFVIHRTYIRVIIRRFSQRDPAFIFTSCSEIYIRLRDHDEIDPWDVRERTTWVMMADTSAGDTVVVRARDGIVRSFGGAEEMLIDLDDDVSGLFTIRLFEVSLLISLSGCLRLENLMVRAMLISRGRSCKQTFVSMSLSQEEFRQVRRDRDDTLGRYWRFGVMLRRRLGFSPSLVVP